MSEVVEFWAWFSEERTRLEALEKARRGNGAEYWTGYADALQDVMNAIKRREVRA